MAYPDDFCFGRVFCFDDFCPKFAPGSFHLHAVLTGWEARPLPSLVHGQMKNKRKLHLGCGLNTPEGWINVDASWNALLAKHPFLKRILRVFRLVPARILDIPWSRGIVIHDLKKPLPFSNDFFSVVYASHLLEHLYLKEAKKLLKECFRVVEPGGVLRIMVPDLRVITMEYVNSKTSGDNARTARAADKFMEDLGMREKNPKNRNFLYRLYNNLTDFHIHKWMYDSDSLIYYLEEAGFGTVEEKKIHESKIEDIATIELNSGLCVEGTK